MTAEIIDLAARRPQPRPRRNRGLLLVLILGALFGAAFWALALRAVGLWIAATPAVEIAGALMWVALSAAMTAALCALLRDGWRGFPGLPPAAWRSQANGGPRR